MGNQVSSNMKAHLRKDHVQTMCAVHVLCDPPS